MHVKKNSKDTHKENLVVKFDSYSDNSSSGDSAKISKDICTNFNIPEILKPSAITKLKFTSEDGWVFHQPIVSEFSKKYNVIVSKKLVSLTKFHVVRVLDFYSKEVIDVIEIPIRKSKIALKAFEQIKEEIFNQHTDVIVELLKVSNMGNPNKYASIKFIAFEHKLDITYWESKQIDNYFKNTNLFIPTDCGIELKDFILVNDSSDLVSTADNLFGNLLDIVDKIEINSKNKPVKYGGNHIKNLHKILTELMVYNFKNVSGVKISFNLDSKNKKKLFMFKATFI